MEQIIKKYLCNFCINNKKEKCIKIKETSKNNIIVYSCENYNKRNEREEQKMNKNYIRYCYYDEIGSYIAIILKDTPIDKIEELKNRYDEVKFEE